MSKLLLFIAVLGLSLQPAYTQDRATAPRDVKPGEVVKISDSLSVKVSKSTAPVFPGVKVKGEALVVTLELIAAKKSATVSYSPSTDAKRSEISLTAGTLKLGPVAVVEDFPSWGKDNDKEVEVLDPKETHSSSSVEFEQQGSVSFLFDIPAAQAKTAKKLTLKFRTTQPAPEQYSLTVVL
ncbi:MAG TPA: hypothetical protein VG778_10590 [Blastocatellia bacterium]|jgi:hypothetical protein|nr:hypothetical protein [Blastocatellia bacterium]